MISAVFRRGGDVSFVVEELKAVFDPRGGQWVGPRYVPSLLAAIGDVIEQHMIDIGFLPDPKEAREGRRELKVVGGTEAAVAAGDGCGRERRGAGGRRNGRRAGVGKRRPGHARLPEMRPAHPDPPGRLRHLHRLHLQQVRVRGRDRTPADPGISQDADRSGFDEGRRGGFQTLPYNVA